MSANPIVRKQIYDVRVPTRQSASDAYQRIEHAHRDSVVRVLGDIMREIGGLDELVLIDRLELDLGTLRADRLEEQLPERIAQRLREKLAIPDDGRRAVVAPQGDARTLRGERADVEALEAFLVTGVLPWWAPIAGSPAERLQKALDNAPEDVAAMLRRRRGVRVARRLALQFPQHVVRRVVSLLAGARRAEIAAVVDDWLTCVAALPTSAHGEADLRVAAVHAGAIGALTEGGEDVVALSQRIRAELAAVATTSNGLEHALRAAAVTAVGIRSPVRRWIERLVSSDRRTLPLESAAAAPVGASGSRPAAERPETAAPAASDAPRPRDATPADGNGDGRALGDRGSPPAGAGPAGSATPGDAAPERPWGLTAADATPHAAVEASSVFLVVDEDVGLVVDNSGLVLLWPFLPRFFAEIELLEEGVFVSAAAAQRGALLLHLVATGEHETPEPSLVINKLLCGVDLEEPVAGGFTPTEAELREIAELHESLLQGWSALGATSVGGLQTSFLRREGVLARQELGWNLKVARRGYDVLLDRLPWGIGLVMLPWMREPLVVEW